MATKKPSAKSKKSALPELKREQGRPTLYRKEYADMVYKLCLMGAIDEKIADVFDIALQTLYNWKRDNPEFAEAIRKGKDIADAEIAEALFHRAKGYSHEEVDVKMYEGQIIKTPLVKHYPPDTGAAMAWLKNRQPRNWRDRHEVDHSSSDGTMSPKSPATMTDEELLAVINKGSSKVDDNG